MVMVVHACHSNIWEAGAGRSDCKVILLFTVSSRPAWAPREPVSKDGFAVVVVVVLRQTDCKNIGITNGNVAKHRVSITPASH